LFYTRFIGWPRGESNARAAGNRTWRRAAFCLSPHRRQARPAGKAGIRMSVLIGGEEFLTNEECRELFPGLPFGTIDSYARYGGPRGSVKSEWVELPERCFQNRTKLTKQRVYRRTDVAALDAAFQAPPPMIELNGERWLPRAALLYYTGLGKNAAESLLYGRMPKYLAQKWNRAFDRPPNVKEIVEHNLPGVGGSVRALHEGDARSITRLLGRKWKTSEAAKPFTPRNWREAPRTSDRDKWLYELVSQRVAPKEIMSRLAKEATKRGWPIPADWDNCRVAIVAYQRRHKLPRLPDARSFNRWEEPRVMRDSGGAWVPIKLIAQMAKRRESFIHWLAPASKEAGKRPYGLRRKWINALWRLPRRKKEPTGRAPGACYDEVFIHADDVAVLLRLMRRPIPEALKACEGGTVATPPPSSSSRPAVSGLVVEERRRPQARRELYAARNMMWIEKATELKTAGTQEICAAIRDWWNALPYADRNATGVPKLLPRGKAGTAVVRPVVRSVLQG
jgi:hypothetical protein